MNFVNQPFVTPGYVSCARKMFELGKMFSSFKNKSGNIDFEPLFRDIVDWNANYFAPAIEKCLDAAVLSQVLTSYAKKDDAVLFQAVNNARFERSVINYTKTQAIFDVNDLGIQQDFSEQVLRANKWVRNVFIGSYDDTAGYGVEYDLIVCNNGYGVSDALYKTLCMQRDALKPGGKLIFNLGFRSHSSNIMFINKALSLAFMQFAAFKHFKSIEDSRAISQGCEKDVLDIINRAGYVLKDVRPYLHGYYNKIGKLFLWPVYMKYFGELCEHDRQCREGSVPKSNQWHEITSEFKKWFPQCANAFAQEQIHGALQKSAKAYFVLEKAGGE